MSNCAVFLCLGGCVSNCAVFLCLGGCVSNCAVSLCLGGCVSNCAVSLCLGGCVSNLCTCVLVCVCVCVCVCVWCRMHRGRVRLLASACVMVRTCGPWLHGGVLDGSSLRSPAPTIPRSHDGHMARHQLSTHSLTILNFVLPRWPSWKMVDISTLPPMVNCHHLNCYSA